RNALKPALEYYNAALGLGFESAELQNNRGHHYLRNRDLDPDLVLARESLDRPITLDARLQAAYHNRALLHLEKLQNGTESAAPAIQDIEPALALGPA